MGLIIFPFNPLFYTNRWVYIKSFYPRFIMTKHKFSSVNYIFTCPKFRSFLANAPKNVVYHTGRSYELFFCCRTVLSEGSTLAAEAIQFGLESYIFDLAPDRWKVMDYRNFPTICVQSSAAVIKYMKGVDAGTYTYPRKAFTPLIEMNGRIPWDIIREDMGLPPKQATHTTSND